MTTALILRTALHAAHAVRVADGTREPLHGHTFHLEVTLEGPVQEDGMIVDFLDIKEALEHWVAPFQYSNWNEFEDQPTVERIARRLWDRIAQGASARSLRLRRLVLWETPERGVVLEP
jgi:6-pyruvoyltetrahydropterin/6-carboxytetrahydropterin synthase